MIIIIICFSLVPMYVFENYRNQIIEFNSYANLIT